MSFIIASTGLLCSGIHRRLATQRAAYCLVYLGFNAAFNTLYRSYHDGPIYGQRKAVHTVGQGSVM